MTERGVKHLAELTDMVREGHRGVMVFLIQRGDADALDLAADIDPVYAAAFERPVRRASKCSPTAARLTAGRDRLGPALPIAGLRVR